MPGKKPVINEEMTEEYLTYQREQERSQATLQKYKHDLNALLMEFLKGKELTKTALISWKDLISKYAPASVNAKFSFRLHFFISHFLSSTSTPENEMSVT